MHISLSPARMKKVQSKLKALERPQHFSHYKSSMGIFSVAQGQLTPRSVVRSGSNLMVVIVTCKNEDQILNEGTRVATIFLFLQVWPNSELIRDFIAVIVTCKN